MTEPLDKIKHRVRLVQLLSSAEQAALAPISLDKLHAFAYLADILSPVWNLRPFEDRIGRTGRPPYYPDLQLQLDLLVGMGLVEPSDLSYQHDDSGDAHFSAAYALRFTSSHLTALTFELSKDPDSAAEQRFLNALADALASLPDEDIARAASRDLAYEGSGSDAEDYLDLEDLTGQSRTEVAVASFDKVFPGSKLTPARRLFMYANYLGRRAHG